MIGKIRIILSAWESTRDDRYQIIKNQSKKFNGLTPKVSLVFHRVSTMYIQQSLRYTQHKGTPKNLTTVTKSRFILKKIYPNKTRTANTKFLLKLRFCQSNILKGDNRPSLFTCFI